MKLYTHRSRRITCLIVFGLFEALPTFARMGGGHSYSGGHSSGGYSGGSYSGGGSGADYGVIELIFRIVFAYPAIGIPILILVVYLFYKAQNASSREVSLTSNDPNSPYGAPALFENVNTSQVLDSLKTQDPNFSRALFMDFVYSLFAHVHTARGQQKIDDYANYFSDPVLSGLKATAQGLTRVDGIVIGSARIYSARINGSQIEIKIGFQANYTEIGARTQSWFVMERWTLVRELQVKSRPPEGIQVLRCPSCGAPLNETRNGRCSACGNRNDRGQFDWLVQFRTEERETREPLLTSNVEEEGTDLPTLYDPFLQAKAPELSKRQTNFSWENFETRVRYVFLELQKAWNTRNWELARPYESDSLFQTHLYWISAYQRQHLRNVLDKVQISEIEVVKVDEDRYYSSVTVRIYANMIDYTAEDSTGKLVCGSKTQPRVFSEYWTFIRSHEAQPVTTASNQCPSCGAPLKINMAGVCEFCKTKVTSGNFDWVLSEIEQDEAYAG